MAVEYVKGFHTASSDREISHRAQTSNPLKYTFNSFITSSKFDLPTPLAYAAGRNKNPNTTQREDISPGSMTNSLMPSHTQPDSPLASS